MAYSHSFNCHKWMEIYYIRSICKVVVLIEVMAVGVVVAVGFIAF